MAKKQDKIPPIYVRILEEEGGDTFIGVYKQEENEFEDCSNMEFFRLMRGMFRNWEQFKLRIFNRILACEECEPLHSLYTEELWKKTKPFSDKEAFELKNQDFQRKVFRTIDVGEMMGRLDAKRIKTDGFSKKFEKYDGEGNKIGMEENNNIFETYEAKGDNIGLNGQKLYAVKCWCTSTNKEHWLWIEEQYKNDPLAAIASCCRLPDNIIPHIKKMKRQGDIFILEMSDEVKPEYSKTRSLTKEEYTSLLVAQS